MEKETENIKLLLDNEFNWRFSKGLFFGILPTRMSSQ